MRNTIRTDLELQVMRCCVCSDEYEVPRRLMRDQDGLLALQEDLAADHRECHEYRDRPELARLSREFRKRVHQEQQKAAGVKLRRRAA
jgi:hypothetical protein